MFQFAEGAEEGAYTIWLDDIQYQTLTAGTLGTPLPAIATESVNKLVGDTHALNGASVTISVNGTAESLAVGRSYFDFTSSAPTVATVSTAGIVSQLAPGPTM